ncbi:Ig lambda-1 chain C [Tupaia chinensis]|uniref:Ig lambda-1 chain C n=1 Tax=Tupaia chinensis TaxID=246437 RepID=L9L1E7_TUPCH|nr:Ig lambda-1 chain C [Tupaia chinensis]
MTFLMSWTGQPKASPTVTLFQPSTEELTTNKATLVCMVNGFYPSDISISWNRDGNSITQGVQTSKPFKQSDNKYGASSYLSMTASDWRHHNLFTCRVVHEGITVEKTVSSTSSS